MLWHSPLQLNLFGWIPGLHLRCLGVSTLQGELILYSLIPLGIVLLILSISRLRYDSVVPALPLVLRLTYLLYPSVSSKGFQTLGECDCFAQYDSSPPLCFLPADYSVQCPGERAPPLLLASGMLAVLVFGVAVPVLYAMLLFACRHAIRSEQETPLSKSLAFLHASLHPWALYWPLIEAARALLLTGFLALVSPGGLLQLLCGLLVAISFHTLQVWISPYRTASNNFLAMAINVSLVLNLVSSLGVQINAKSSNSINATLLSVALYTAAFAVYLVTLLSLLAALRQRISPEELRGYLLDDDTAAIISPGYDAPLPLIARLGDFSINAADMQRALHAPLLTAEEVEVLRNLSVLSAERASVMSNKYTSDAADLLLKDPSEAARGIVHQLGLPYLELLARMAKGVEAIKEDMAASGTADDKRWLHYVLHEPAAAHEGLHDPTRVGKHLDYFINHPKTRAAGLEEVHVVALRLYTSQAYSSLNEPLRRPNGPHPFAATIAFVSEGIKRLRTINAPERVWNASSHSIDVEERGSVRLWRGLCNVRGEITRMGGTELAPLSCTPDLATAAQFAMSREALLFLVTAKNFMQRGAALDFLSCLPHEREVCYPPCTYLKPTGRRQQVELPGELRCVVIEVTPHVGS